MNNSNAWRAYRQALLAFARVQGARKSGHVSGSRATSLYEGPCGVGREESMKFKTFKRDVQIILRGHMQQAETQRREAVDKDSAIMYMRLADILGKALEEISQRCND